MRNLSIYNRLILLWLLWPALVIAQYGQAPFDPPSTIPSQQHPIVLYTDQDGIDSLRSRVNREPYSSWYSSLASDAASFKDSDGPATSDEYEHGLGMLQMALYWIISEDGDYLTALLQAGWMDTSPTFNTFKSDGEIYKLVAYDIIADSISSGERTAIYSAIKARVDNHDADSRVTNLKAINGALHMLSGLLLQDENASWANDRLAEGIANVDTALIEVSKGGIWSEGGKYGSWVSSVLFFAYKAYDNFMSVDMWDSDRFRDFMYWVGTDARARRTGFTWTYDDQNPYHAHDYAIWPALVNSSNTQQDTARIIRGYHSYAIDNIDGTNFVFRGGIASNLAYFHDTQADVALTPDTTYAPPSTYNERAGQLHFADNHNGGGLEGLFTFETFNNASTSFHEHRKGLSYEIWYSHSGYADSALVTISQPGYGANDVNNWFKNWNDHNVITHTAFNDNANHNDDDPYLGGVTDQFSVAIGHYTDETNDIDWKRMLLHVRDHDIVLFADWVEDLNGTNRNWSSRMRVRYGQPGDGGSGTYTEDGSKQYAYYDTTGIEVRIDFLLPDVTAISKEDVAIEYRGGDNFWPATHLAFSGTGFNSTATLLTAGAIQIQPTAESYYTPSITSNGGVFDDGAIEYNIVAQEDVATIDENDIITNGKYAVIADASNVIQWYFTYDANSLNWMDNNVFTSTANLDGVMISIDSGGKWEGLIKENTPTYYLSLYTPSEPDSILINGTKTVDWVWDPDNYAIINISVSGTYTLCADYGAGDCGTAGVTETPQGGEDPPTAPMITSFTSVGKTSMQLNWADNSNNETGFRLYWSTTNSKPGSHNAAVGANVTSYTMMGLNCGTTYYVWVEAYNDAGTAQDTDNRTTAVCTTPPAGTPDTGPPFPRIAGVGFYPVHSTDIYDYHDVVGLRYYHISSAESLRTTNSDVIILGLNDEIRGGDEGPIRRVFSNDKYPKVWRVTTTDGQYLKFTNNAYLMNVTADCPDTLTEFGSMNFSEYLARALVAYSDTTLYDGIFFDFWATTIFWSQVNLVDLNLNGTADNSETGVTTLWQAGNRFLVEEIYSVWGASTPIVAHETETAIADTINGWGNENWRGRSWDSEFALMVSQYNDNESPKLGIVELALNYIDGDNLETGAPNSSNYYTTPLKDQYQYIRYGLATAGMLGLYFAVDEGANFHRFTGLIYDEFLAELGDPSGTYENVSRNNFIKVRYFESGGDTLGCLLTNTAGDTSKVYLADLESVTTGDWYHFKGAQDPTVNDGTVFDDYVMQGSGGDNSASQTGDGLLLLVGLDTLVAPIIIGNTAYNVTSPGQNPVVLAGAWESGLVDFTKSNHGVRLGWGNYGEAYKFAPPDASTYADFVAQINLPGSYSVYEWHNNVGAETVGGNDIGNASTNVTYRVFHAGGTDDQTVDQSAAYAQWNLLGTYDFIEGNSAKVRVLTTNADGDVVSIDAIKFVLQSAEAPPAPPARVRRRAPVVN